MIQEHNLINLGFTTNLKEVPECIATDDEFTYYFTLKLGHPQYGLWLVTNCENEVERHGGWFVRFSGVGGFKRITNLNELMDLINTLKKFEQ